MHGVAPHPRTKGGKDRTTHLGLDDLEVAHLDAAGGEVGDLELDLDGPARLGGRAAADAAHAAAEAPRHAAAELVVALDAGQAELGAHEEFAAAAELLDAPDDGALLGRVVHAADGGAEARRVGVLGHGHHDLDVVGGAAALELGARLEHELDARARVQAHVRLDPHQRLDLRVEPVAHQLELAVRRDEADGAVVLEARQPHALVELDVLHLDRLAPRRASRRLEHGLVVEPEPQLRHARQVALHLDGA